jgi:serine/threonine protein kinase/tetratricopeptide (TPR) repeat protein
MICNNCGAKNEEDAKFCNSCGEDQVTGVTKAIPGEIDYIVPGQLIINNRFKILKKIGKGGMGEILLAEDVKLKRKVAVKRILTKALSDPASKARFLREAQTASQLDHTNICTIYEIYEEDETDYIVMQYIDGITLNHIIKIEKLSISKVLDIAIQICEGLNEANSKKIIHRDIKPANIMVDKKGIIKILDFGLAKFRDKSIIKKNGMVDSNLTERGIVLGTVSHISPEQARGQGLDQRTDIFSFGIVLYEMLEGQNPFLEEEQISTLYNVINKEIEFIREIPDDLKKIVLKSLEKDINKRYTGFSQLKTDLEDFRVRYTRSRQGVAPDGRTEKIDHQEQERLLKEIQKTTDKENLGDIVYRIKRFKAYTEPMVSTKRNKLKYIVLPVVLILTAFLFYFFLIKDKNHPLIIHDENFYIYLHGFENKTGEKGIAKKFNYLLRESLNQFDRFKVIDIETVPSRSRDGITRENLAQLSEKFNIEYELTGSITKEQGFYNIDAKLISFRKKEEKSGEVKKIEKTITSTGQDLDSFLTIQADMITSRVYSIFFAEQETVQEIKKMSKIYGSDWRKFSALYYGHQYLKRLESGNALKYLLQAKDIPAAKYLLAEAYSFRGDRAKAVGEIIEAAEQSEKLTRPLRLRAQALQARLRFDFREEINNRQALMECFPFSKEAFYEMGEAYFQHRRPMEAIKYFEEARKLDRDYSNAINHLAYCYSFTGDHVKAIQLFEEYRNLDKTANSFDSLGDGYFYKGDLSFAEQFKQNAVKMDENSVPYSYTTLADIYILKAEYKKAREALDNYYRVKKDDQAKARITATKAFIFNKNRELDKALKTVDRSLQIFDSDDIANDTSEAHWLKGLILLELNKVEESKKELEWLSKFKNKYDLKAENFSDPYKLLFHLQALILEKEGRLDEAETTLKSLLKIKEKLSFWTYFHYQFFHTEYARFLTRKNLYREALVELKTCLEFNQNYIPALWLKAEISGKLKNIDKKDTVNIYKKIKELYGESGEKNFLRNRLTKKIN